MAKKIIRQNWALREDKTWKIEYNQIPVDMITKLARHYTDGWGVHWPFNWFDWNKQYMEDCKKSAFRHFIQWFSWEDDEEHDMACVWNIFAYEMLKIKLEWKPMSKYMRDVLDNNK